MGWLIPRENPYWNKKIGKELEFERREKLLEIMRPTLADWETLERMKLLLLASSKEANLDKGENDERA